MQSIGERLEEARKRKGISIREAAESTKIRSDYLHKFENNQYDIRLPEIYVRGFLRSYASFLKLPSDKIIADYNALNHIDPKASPRTVSREVYGRMDISTTKEHNNSESGSPASSGGSAPPMAADAAGAASAPSATAPRNPVTFTPPAHSTGSPIDRKLLIKIGGLVAITVLVLIFIIVGVSKCSSGGGAPTPRATDTTWVRPQPTDNTFDIIAKNGPVSVTVISTANGMVFYQGTIHPGDKRTLPRRVEMRLEATPYSNIELDFHDNHAPYQIAGPTLIKTAAAQ